MRLMTAYICLNIMQDFFNATYEKYLSNYLHPLTSKTLCGWVQSMKLKSPHLQSQARCEKRL